MINKKIVTIFWYTILFWALAVGVVSAPLFIASMYFAMNPSTAVINTILVAAAIILFLAALALYVYILKQILKNLQAKSDAIALLPIEEQRKMQAYDRKYLLWFIPFIILIILLVYKSKQNQEYMEQLDLDAHTYTNEEYGISYNYCEGFSKEGKLENANGHIYYLNMNDNKNYNRWVSFDIIKKTSNNIKVYNDTFGAGLNKKEFEVDGYPARSWESNPGTWYGHTLIEKDNAFIKITSNSKDVGSCYQSVMNSLELIKSEP